MVEKLTIQERTPEQIKKEQEAEIMNGMKKSLGTIENQVLRQDKTQFVDQLPDNMEVQDGSNLFIKERTGKDVPESWDEVDNWFAQQEVAYGSKSALLEHLLGGTAKISLMGVASWLKYKSGNSDARNRELAQRRVSAIREYLKKKIQSKTGEVVKDDIFVHRYHHFDKPPKPGASADDSQGVNLSIIKMKGKELPPKPNPGPDDSKEDVETEGPKVELLLRNNPRKIGQGQGYLLPFDDHGDPTITIDGTVKPRDIKGDSRMIGGYNGDKYSNFRMTKNNMDINTPGTYQREFTYTHEYKDKNGIDRKKTVTAIQTIIVEPHNGPRSPDIIKDNEFTKKVKDITEKFVDDLKHNGIVDGDIAHDYTHRNLKIEEKESNATKAVYEVSSWDAKSKIEFNAAYCGCDRLSLENVQKIAVYSERTGGKGAELFIERKPKESFEQFTTRALSLANMINRLDHHARTPKNGNKPLRDYLGRPLKIAQFEASGDKVQLDFDGTGFLGSLTGKFFDVDGVRKVSEKYGVSAKDLANHMNIVWGIEYRA